MTAAKLSFNVSATGIDLRLCVSLDDVVIYDQNPALESQIISHEFQDTDDQEHILVFEMQGKLAAHTTVSDTGEILQDSVIKLSDIAFDDIALGYMFTELAQYYHDTNGTTAPVIEPFYGVMGCNGRVELKFTTPIYLWLLENM
jgi:hypothetical protein